MTNRDNWGWRARFGMFIVSCEAVPEAEWWAMMPTGISVHASRIDAPAPWASWTDDSQAELNLAPDLIRGAGHFAAMRLDGVVVGHSSSSILGGPNWDNAIIKRLCEILPDGTSVTTNGLDCVAALRACRITRPFVVFPPWFNETLVETGLQYFSSSECSPAGLLKADPGRQWQDLPPEQLYPQGMGFEQDVELLYRQILRATPGDADGVLIVGTGFRCAGIINALEADLNRPVVTANQASLWHCMRMSGVRSSPAGYGKLFDLDKL